MSNRSLQREDEPIFPYWIPLVMYVFSIMLKAAGLTFVIQLWRLAGMVFDGFWGFFTLKFARKD